MPALGRATQVHYNQVLSNIAVQFEPPDLQAKNVAPVKPVENRSDVFPVFDKSMFNVVDDVRSDGGEAHEVSRGWDYTPYLVEKRALREPITKDQRANWDSQVDLEASTTEFLKQLVWNGYEQRMFGAGGYLRTTTNSTYVNASVNWSNLSTASPRTDIDVAKNNIAGNCGRQPNTIVLGDDIARLIMRTSEYRDEYKYVQDIRNASLPATLYDMNAVYVSSLLNTAMKGQQQTLTRIMSDDVWIGYIDPNGPGYKTITWGATLMTYEEVTSWYDPAKKADMIEYEANFCFKRIAAECGGLLQAVSS